MSQNAIEKAIENYTPSSTVAQLQHFATLESAIAKTLRSENSMRIYAQTFDAWRRWCDENGVNYFAMTGGNVYDFLASADTSKATRQRQLSTMRKAAQMLVILDGAEALRMYESLKVIKAPAPDKSKKRKNKNALAPSEVDALLRQWTGADALARRNDAMLRLLVFTGMRRSELAALRWSDIDMTRGIVHVIDGKGDKDRNAAIMDSTGYTIEALRLWRAYLPSDYEYVFVAVGRNGVIDTDAPVSDKTVERVVKATAKRAGIDGLLPHDLRRTHITESLATGGTLADTQAQVGHADGSTTLLYAQSVEAEQRRNNSKFRFGAVKPK